MWQFLASLVLGIIKLLFVNDKPEERVAETLEPQIERGDHERVLDAADALVQHRAESKDRNARGTTGGARPSVGSDETTVFIARQG